MTKALLWGGLILLFTFAPVSHAAAQTSCVPPTSGLISWWPGDGNPDDIIDLNHGTLQAGATFTEGKVGQAFSFPGMEENRVEIADSANLDITGALTIAAWVNVSGVEGDFAAIVAKFGSIFEFPPQPNSGYGFFITPQPDRRLQGFLGTGQPLFVFVLSDGPIPLNSFTHVAMTYDPSLSSENLKLYINGMQDGNTTVAATILTNDVPLTIGARFAGSPLLVQHFNGTIDEVQIYNRALSAEEIQAIFLAGSAGNCKVEPATFLIIDEDSIDNGKNCSDADFATGPGCVSVEECAFGACPGADPPSIVNNDPSVLVNDDIASIPGVAGGCQAVLTITTIAPPAVPITLPTGEVGDEGLFSPAPGALVGIPGGLPGYINCAAAQDENFLDGITGAPLTAQAIAGDPADPDDEGLVGRTVCAVVHDSNISDLGGGLLNMKGARNGRTAFIVTSVVPHPQGGDLLPVLEVDFLDSPDKVDEACECENLVTIDGEPYDCTALVQ